MKLIIEYKGDDDILLLMLKSIKSNLENDIPNVNMGNHAIVDVCIEVEE